MATISQIKLPGVSAAYDIDAVKVGGHSVLKDVPADAKFTDTTYVFNTAYDATTNKAATMSDINAAIYAAMEGSY